MKRTIIIIVIGTLVLVAAFWGASRHFGWFLEEIAEPVDTFVYDDTQPIDLKDKTKVYDLIVLDMSGSMGWYWALCFSRSRENCCLTFCV